MVEEAPHLAPYSMTPHSPAIDVGDGFITEDEVEKFTAERAAAAAV